MSEQSTEIAAKEPGPEMTPNYEEGNRGGQPNVPTRANVEVDESKAAVCYANFCRVTGTPEELILDFSLNASPFGVTSTVQIAQRLILNYYTAKRLLQALAVSVQRHEAAFGVLETDVQKRVTPSAKRAMS